MRGWGAARAQDSARRSASAPSTSSGTGGPASQVPSSTRRRISAYPHGPPQSSGGHAPRPPVQRVLHDEAVHPVVAEVVPVVEAVTDPRHDVGQPHCLLPLQVAHQVAVRPADLALSHPEQVQVHVLPAHHDLHGVVHPAEVPLPGQDQPPPDGWLDLQESHFELVRRERARTPTTRVGGAHPQSLDRLDRWGRGHSGERAEVEGEWRLVCSARHPPSLPVPRFRARRCRDASVLGASRAPPLPAAAKAEQMSRSRFR